MLAEWRERLRIIPSVLAGRSLTLLCELDDLTYTVMWTGMPQPPVLDSFDGTIFQAADVLLSSSKAPLGSPSAAVNSLVSGMLLHYSTQSAQIRRLSPVRMQINRISA